MLTTLLVIQIFLALALVCIILLQRTATDGLSGLAGGSSGNSLISGRASANIMTKTTAFLAAAFMVNSMAMATITARTEGVADKVIESLENAPAAEPAAPKITDEAPAPTPAPAGETSDTPAPANADTSAAQPAPAPAPEEKKEKAPAIPVAH